MDEPKEVLDLVNEQDEVIGTVVREEILDLERTGKGYVRAVGVFLVNNAGKLWIPRRQPYKKIAPGGLDFSAAEHVISGESYEDAAIRGIQEELHLRASHAQLQLVGTIKPFTGMPYFHPMYTYPYNDVPDFNANDFSGYEWLSPLEVQRKLLDGEPAKDFLLPAIRLLIQQGDLT